MLTHRVVRMQLRNPILRVLFTLFFIVDRHEWLGHALFTSVDATDRSERERNDWMRLISVDLAVQLRSPSTAAQHHEGCQR